MEQSSIHIKGFPMTQSISTDSFTGIIKCDGKICSISNDKNHPFIMSEDPDAYHSFRFDTRQKPDESSKVLQLSIFDDKYGYASRINRGKDVDLIEFSGKQQADQFCWFTYIHNKPNTGAYWLAADNGYFLANLGKASDGVLITAASSNIQTEFAIVPFLPSPPQ